MPESRSRWIVVAAAVAAYACALLGVHVYDDLHAVRDNTAIRSLADVPRLFWDLDAFSSLNNRMYRPVLLLTYAVDHALGGGAVWVFKLTNLAVHVASSLLVLGLVRRLGAAPRAALLGAVFFAVHPLASEAVNTASGRSELLSVAAILAAMVLYLDALRGRAPGWSTSGIAVCAVVACGSKETGALLPFVLAALLCTQLRAIRSRATLVALLRILPAALVCLGYLALRRHLFGVATAMAPPLVGGADPTIGAGRDLLTQLCTMATLLPRALAQMILPVGLSLDPEVRFVAEPGSAPVVAGASMMVLVTWLGLRRPRRSPLLFVGTVVAWAIALPWVLLPLNSPYLEHRLYGPLAGAALLVAAAGGRLVAHGRRLALGAGAVVAAAFAFGSAARSLDYRDPLVIWGKVVASQPGSVRGLCGLALAYMETGRWKEALPLVQRAVAVRPSDSSACKNLVELNLKLLPAPGNAMTAVVIATRLVRRTPNDMFARLRYSRALAALGDATGEQKHFDAAVEEALYCLEIAPPKGLFFRTAAHARLRSGNPQAALELLDRSVAAGLDHHTVLLDRSKVLRQLGRVGDADRDLQRVLAVAPFDPAVMAAVQARAAVPGR